MKKKIVRWSYLWYVQLAIVALGFVLVTLGVGHCETWGIDRIENDYVCVPRDLNIFVFSPIYDNKEYCEDTAYALNRAHWQRLENLKWGRPEKPDLTNKERKGIQPCSLYDSNGCVEK